MKMSHEDFLEQMNVEIPLILGATPSGGILLLTMSRIHARMFFFKTRSQSNTDERVYVYVYAYLCIDCGSWYQCFSVWTVSCMRMCFRVHMHAYMQLHTTTNRSDHIHGNGL